MRCDPTRHFLNLTGGRVRRVGAQIFRRRRKQKRGMTKYLRGTRCSSGEQQGTVVRTISDLQSVPGGERNETSRPTRKRTKGGGKLSRRHEKKNLDPHRKETKLMISRIAAFKRSEAEKRY